MRRRFCFVGCCGSFLCQCGSYFLAESCSSGAMTQVVSLVSESSN